MQHLLVHKSRNCVSLTGGYFGFRFAIAEGMKSIWLSVLTISSTFALGCANDGFQTTGGVVDEEPVDECPPAEQQTYYADADGDGYGDAEQSVSDCVAVQGYVTDNTDCNDQEGFAHPGHPELCGDEIDNNCNGGDVCVGSRAARWAFTAVDGTTVEDESGKLLIGTLEGGLLNTPEASLTFDGSDDFVLFEDAELYQLPIGTVALWFKAATIDKNQALLSKDSAGTDTGGQLTIYLDAGGSVRARLQSNNQSYQVVADPVSAGSWHHVIFKFGGNEGMNLRVDEGNAASDPYTGGMVRNYEPLVVGASTDLSGNLVARPITRPFAGEITEVQFYDRQLLPEESAGLRLTTAPVGALP
jgi:hypothetical protein